MSPQLTFTCSKSILETLQKGGKYNQSKHKKHQNKVNNVVLVFLLLTLNISHTFLYC